MTFTKVLEALFNLPSIILGEIIDAGKRIFVDIKEVLNGKYDEQESEEEDTTDII